MTIKNLINLLEEINDPDAEVSIRSSDMQLEAPTVVEYKRAAYGSDLDRWSEASVIIAA